MAEEKKLSLKEYLIKQDVPTAMIRELASFRKTHGDMDPEYAARVRPPKVMYVDAYTDESGRVISRGILRRALAAFLAGDNLLLTGPKGSGKNVLADTLAFITNRPLFEMPMHVHADAESLLGKDTFKPVPVEREIVVGVDKDGKPIKTTVIERQGEVQFNLAQFVISMQIGGVAVLDEINMARPEATAVLHSILDDRKRVDIPGMGLVQAHPAARVIATMNYGYAGTQELNEALSDRFVPLEVPAMTIDEITLFMETRFPGIKPDLAKQLGALFHEMLKKVEATELQSRSVTFRGLLQAVRLILMGLSPHEAVTTCVVNRTFDQYERKLLTTLVDARFPKSWTAVWAFPKGE